MGQNNAIIVAVSFLAALAVAAIIVIIAKSFSTADKVTLIAVVVAFVAPIITSLLALVKATQTNGQLKAHLDGKTDTVQQ